MKPATGDVTILKHFIEVWEKQIVLYVEKYKDNMTARNILAQRKIGEEAGIDVVQKFERKGEGAGIVARGAIPPLSDYTAETTEHVIYQIATHFVLNRKDTVQDPKTKTRLMDIAMRDIHRFEDRFALEGDASLGVKGIVDAARANTEGTVTAKGAWKGETGTDIHDDVNEAISRMDEDFDPAYLVGRRRYLRYLFRLDAERQPYYKTIAPLFGKTPEDTTWLWMTNAFSPAIKHVYLVPKDPMAGEWVVSENPKVLDYGLQPGQNYLFEVAEWATVEIHQNNAYVEIDIKE